MKTTSFFILLTTAVSFGKALDLESETSLTSKNIWRKAKNTANSVISGDVTVNDVLDTAQDVVDYVGDLGNSTEADTLYTYDEICNDTSGYTECSSIDTDNDGMIS